MTLGAVAAPMLAKVGYGKNEAGGLLAAGGLGAIISPPVLGAAAFLIAEFLKISYLDVLLMAVIPTCLYYLTLFLMVEIDVRKFGMKNVVFESVESAWSLTKKYWFHFLSLVSIIAFMLMGFSPELSVFWATVVSFVTSFLHRDCALFSYDFLRGREPFVQGFFGSPFFKALDGGTRAVLNVAATCAGAGLIVGVVTLTGLGLKFSSIVLAYAGNSLLLTAIYTALIVWIVGLAVPVTASYIICAVIAAPALIALKVPEFAAHMFIFYYAVLSEVSPPTALSPFAAAAITGGDPYKTTLQCWKYTTPAFLVPFMFVLDPSGTGLLLTGSFKTLGNADWGSIALVTFTAAVGIMALAGALPGLAVQEDAALRARWCSALPASCWSIPRRCSTSSASLLVVAVLASQWIRERSPMQPWADEVHRELTRAGVRIVGYVPDGGHKRLIELCLADKSMRAVVLTHRGGGHRPRRRRLARRREQRAAHAVERRRQHRQRARHPKTCRFPLVMVVTMRGEAGEFNSWQVPMGEGTPGVVRDDGRGREARDRRQSEVAPLCAAALKGAISDMRCSSRRR